jgi:hypothetical protein
MWRLIEKSKVHFNLHWIEQMRSIEEYDINYDHRRIFSFDFLCEKDAKEAFGLIKPNIEADLNEKTFWMIAHLIGHVLGEDFSRRIAVMYVERVIH